MECLRYITGNGHYRHAGQSTNDMYMVIDGIAAQDLHTVFTMESFEGEKPQ